MTFWCSPFWQHANGFSSLMWPLETLHTFLMTVPEKRWGQAIWRSQKYLIHIIKQRTCTLPGNATFGNTVSLQSYLFDACQNIKVVLHHCPSADLSGIWGKIYILMKKHTSLKPGQKVLWHTDYYINAMEWSIMNKDYLIPILIFEHLKGWWTLLQYLVLQRQIV